MTKSIFAVSLALLVAIVPAATIVQAQSADDFAVLFTTAGPASERLVASFTLDTSPSVECAVTFNFVIFPENGLNAKTYRISLSKKAPWTSVPYDFAVAAREPGERIRVRGLYSNVALSVQGMGRCVARVSAEKSDVRSGESRGEVSVDPGGLLGWATFPNW